MPGSPESLALTAADRLTIRNWVAGGAVRGVAPAPTAPVATNQVAGSTTVANDGQEGRGLFVSLGCVACHKIEGQGGVAGPDLSHEAKLGHSSQWLMTQITDPLKHVPTTIMPAHKNLTPPQLKSLADFILNPAPGQAPASAQPIAAAPLVSTNTPAAPAPTNQLAASAAASVIPAKSAAGQTNPLASTSDGQEGSGLFVSVGCATCHKIEGQGGVAGPDLSQEAKLGRSSQWLISQITDPTRHDPSTTMPADKNLSQPQLKSLADYILKPSSSSAAPGAGRAPNAAIQPTVLSSTPTQAKASPGQSSARPDGAAQAASATVVKMIGDPRHGAVLFDLDCAKCHGKAGEGHVPNPGSQAGVVSPLAPIARGLFSDDPLVFAENIDRIIQHGVTPPGPAPALTMPAFGDTRALTLPEIANIEAYVLSLNGVDAAKIIHPGITPSHFVAGTVALFALALLVVGGLWVHSRTSSLAQTGGHPTPEEFQALKHEVTDLKHKLGEMETRNPKEHE